MSSDERMTPSTPSSSRWQELYGGTPGVSTPSSPVVVGRGTAIGSPVAYTASKDRDRDMLPNITPPQHLEIELTPSPSITKLETPGSVDESTSSLQKKIKQLSKQLQDEVSSRRHYEEEAENYRITNDALQSEVAEQAQSTDNLRGLLYKKTQLLTTMTMEKEVLLQKLEAIKPSPASDSTGVTISKAKNKKKTTESEKLLEQDVDNLKAELAAFNKMYHRLLLEKDEITEELKAAQSQVKVMEETQVQRCNEPTSVVEQAQPDVHRITVLEETINQQKGKIRNQADDIAELVQELEIERRRLTDAENDLKRERARVHDCKKVIADLNIMVTDERKTTDTMAKKLWQQSATINTLSLTMRKFQVTKVNRVIPNVPSQISLAKDPGKGEIYIHIRYVGKDLRMSITDIDDVAVDASNPTRFTIAYSGSKAEVFDSHDREEVVDAIKEFRRIAKQNESHPDSGPFDDLAAFMGGF